jgi:ABC-type uncharacterized transport system auxiliary subunit
MKSIQRFCLCGILSVFVFLSIGCSFNTSNVKKTAYILNVPTPTKTQSTAVKNASLFIESTTISPVFSSRYFTYRKSTVVYDNDYYNYFFIPASTQVNEALHQWITNANLFSTVLNDQDIQKPTYILQTNITKLYVDYINQQAVIALTINLLKTTDTGATLVFQKNYESSLPVNNFDGSTLINTWSIGLKNILAQMMDDLRATMFKAL